MHRRQIHIALYPVPLYTTYDHKEKAGDKNAGGEFDRFSQLSVALTGFSAAELQTTGLMHVYFDELGLVLGPVARVAAEFIGDGKAKQSERQLVFGVDRQDISTDRFGFFRLVERAVDFRFRDSFRDACLRNTLQLEFHRGTSLYQLSQVPLTPGNVSLGLLLPESYEPASIEDHKIRRPRVPSKE